ncbi:hypothetical protein E0H99_10395 [Flavobacterium sp. GT3P67]|nr:hypothetical protein E0H99_10395 [Flavobacterium sp. GT3P67]
MLSHMEHSTFQWNRAHYPKYRDNEVSQWHEAFVNVRRWMDKN